MGTNRAGWLRWLILVGAAFGAAMLLSGCNPDRTFTVTSTADAVDANAGDGACDDGGGNCTLRAAIMEANASGGLTQINLPAGTYTLSIAGAGEDQAVTGDLDITGRVWLFGSGAVIDAAGLDRALDIHESALVNGLGFEITGGYANGGPGDQPRGGGVRSTGALNLTNVVVTENQVDCDPAGSEGPLGGGIFATSLNLTNSTISDNTVEGTGCGSGGGGGLVLVSGTVAGSHVDGNEVVNASIGAGGGVVALGSVEIRDSTVTGNSSSTVGGVLAIGDDGTEESPGGVLTVDRTTISENHGAQFAGGVMVSGESRQAVIVRSSIWGNEAPLGAGIVVATFSPDPTLDLRESTVSGNEAFEDLGQLPSVTARGGGVFLSHSTATMTNSTITGNLAPNGGGGVYLLDFQSGLMLSGTAIASNPSGADCSLGAGSWVTSGGYNADSDGSCTLTQATDQSGVDPLLGPLGDNGGPTLTHLPLSESPLLNQVPVGVNGCGTEPDQRGVARPQGPACDIGAVEEEPPPPPVVPLEIGGGRNFLGTGNDPPNHLPPEAHENLWLGVSGPCASKENGDLVSATTDANYQMNSPNPPGGNPGPVGSSVSWVSCTGGNTVPNADHDPDGYFYAVHVPEEYAGGALAVEIFDAPQCSSRNADGSNTNFPASQTGDGVDAGLAGNAANHSTRYRMRDADASPSEPTDNPLLVTTTFTMNQNAGACGGSADDWQNRWRVLHTLIDPVPGATYFVQVDSFDPSLNAAERHVSNSFAIRVNPAGGVFEPCTVDPLTATAELPYLVSCPTVTAPRSMSVLTNLSGSQSTFTLTRVEPEHGGRTLEVRVWDPGEGTRALELLDPNGATAAFDWEIVDGTGSDAAPTGGWSGSASNFTAGGFNVFGLDTLGNDPQNDCRGWNLQPGGYRGARSKYSDRMVVLRVALPDDIGAAYGGNTTWRVRYTTGGGSCSPTDRTTWSARIVD